ncbi:MAG: PLP-dependent aminotransferase family protein [Microbacteriaceae bacterium]|nr:PLP-dependent aminotransferase family protein [Microbacteriaceae bacterium]
MITLSARALASRLQEWRSSDPAYRALADRIRLLVLDGVVAPGTRLPAERELAAELGVSRTTIAAAYADLRDDGSIESVRGSGSVVRSSNRPMQIPDLATGPIDFSKATMPVYPGLAAAIRAATEQLPAMLAESGFDPLGRDEVRAAIAQRYTDRGLPTTPDQIMVTVGAQHAITLIARTVLRRGDRVLIENPTYPHAMDSILAAGGRLVPVPVDAAEGWDENALAQVIERGSPALAYLMPDNHNPTGATMPTPLLERSLALAAAHGTVVVVDETMGELTIDGPRRLPAAAYGPAVLLGSVGKSLWGGLRLGWVRADPSFIRTLTRARFASDLGTPAFEQTVVAGMLPDFDRVLDERVAWLRAGREHVLAELARRFPEWRVPVPGGGLTAWAGLGRPVSSQLVLAARSAGLVITPGPRFAADGAFERFLRIPFSHPVEFTDRALDVLERVWARVAGGAVRAAEVDDFAAVI